MRTSVAAIVAASSLALAACADDHYLVQLGGPASAATETAMAADLHACKMASVHRFYQEGGGNGGAIGGVLGGAAGALIGIGLQGETGGLVPSDMNRMTEACMRARGYEGASR